MQRGPSSTRDKIILFTIDKALLGLPVSLVEHVTRAVEIRPLPRAPQIIHGLINVRGMVVPVIDLRLRLRMPAKELDCDDRFIIARTSTRVVALVVDSVLEILETPSGTITGREGSPPLADGLQGVVKLEDGLVLIYDLDLFLSLDDERRLESALS